MRRGIPHRKHCGEKFLNTENSNERPFTIILNYRASIKHPLGNILYLTYILTVAGYVPSKETQSETRLILLNTGAA